LTDTYEVGIIERMPSAHSSPTDGEAPNLATLVGVFARDANLKFGGGTATAETLRREIVLRRHYATESDFRLAYAASRLTPGTNLLALCTGLGWRIRGVFGALSALISSSIPSGVAVAVIMAGYERTMGNRVLASASRGAVAVAAALLISSAWALVRPNAVRDRRRTAAIVGASWFLYQVMGLSAFVVLIAAGALGAIWREQATS